MFWLYLFFWLTIVTKYTENNVRVIYSSPTQSSPFICCSCLYHSLYLKIACMVFTTNRSYCAQLKETGSGCWWYLTRNTAKFKKNCFFLFGWFNIILVHTNRTFCDWLPRANRLRIDNDIKCTNLYNRANKTELTSCCSKSVHKPIEKIIDQSHLKFWDSFWINASELKWKWNRGFENIAWNWANNTNYVNTILMTNYKLTIEY